MEVNLRPLELSLPLFSEMPGRPNLKDMKSIADGTTWTGLTRPRGEALRRARGGGAASAAETGGDVSAPPYRQSFRTKPT
ncbi:hypothetical protein Pden_3276 [Paracoccus denitrificans PD1222]|uniref:Uncharacterized protein n=1 Tax=Paracoccus denitrificans (strain Pd 1222) TaxID=318586 RepID=A1B760_PARDP|nr:hypothetical protein Pden_3276 [Paracoccus denitrificans PD1222]